MVNGEHGGRPLLGAILEEQFGVLEAKLLEAVNIQGTKGGRLVSKKDIATIVVKLSTEVEGLSIHYSFDNSFPDNFYPAYNSPLTVPKDASFVKVITYRDNKPVGRMMVMPVEELKKRAGIK